jgi:replicative DNA helicase
MQLTNINLSNPDLERQVLGAAISYPHSTDIIFKILNAGAFYHYEELAKIMYTMYHERKPIDLITVAEASRNAGISMALISEVASLAMAPANIEYHSRILYQYQLSRNLAQVAQKTQSDILQGADPFDVIERLKTVLNEALPSINKDSHLLSELNTVQRIEDTLRNGYKTYELPIKAPNGYPVEFEHGNMIILAAGPSVGKTAFMLNICFHLAQRNTPVCIFNFESGMHKLKYRIVSMFTGIGSEKIKRGLLNDVQMEQIRQAVQSIDSMPIYFNEKARDIIGLEIAIRELNAKGVNLFFVDNMSNVTLPQAERTDLKIGAYLKEITRLKKDLGVTICILTHLSRENDKNKSNLLSRLRNSGEYEQDGDQIFFLSQLDGDQVELTCAKHRDGATFSTILDFNKDIQQFKNQSFGIEEAQIFEEFPRFSVPKQDEIVF